MNYLEKLDNIILSDNVVNNFYNAYNNDIKFQQELDKNIPEIKICEKQDQNHPWHKYNVLSHILHSIDAINKQTISLPPKDRRLLAYAMFFHDMGKPKCHGERIKNGKKIDSFYGHNIESSKIVRKYAKILGFDKNETRILDKLVLKHDIFMFIKDFPTNNPNWRTLSKDVINNEISDLNSVGDGIKLMRYLIMIGRSDNLAQNKKMTGESLEMLDKMDGMVDEIQSK